MNRIASRGFAVIILALVLFVGFGLFITEFIVNSDSWVVNPGSPHVFKGENLNCGVVVDSEGILLLDMQNDRTYSSSEQIRKSTVHWVGDRKGKISSPALATYADAMVGYDLVNGVYAYEDAAGLSQMTINTKVQLVALEALGDKKGTVAVYNYKTGQILCAVSTPTYDPDNIPENIEDIDGVYWNRFTQSAYIPGSIFKAVTLAAALEEIPDIESRTFVCDGTCELGSDTINCEVPHYEQTLKAAFTNSCNCVFGTIAQELGAEKLSKYVDKFGVIESIRFDGVETAAGAFSKTDEPVFLGLSAIGQHKDQINPCTFMVYMGAVANGGRPVMPHIVEQVWVGESVTYQAQTAVGKAIMSSHTADTVKDYMRNNVTQKYGDWNFQGLNVCAKTGTAEVGGAQKPNAMFAGFVDNEQYPLAFVVCVEDGGYGSTTCIPIASKVLEACKAVIDQTN